MPYVFYEVPYNFSDILSRHEKVHVFVRREPLGMKKYSFSQRQQVVRSADCRKRITGDSVFRLQNEVSIGESLVTIDT